MEKFKKTYVLILFQLFAQFVGTLTYYTIIIQCIVVFDSGIISPYNTTIIHMDQYTYHKWGYDQLGFKSILALKINRYSNL